MEYVFLTIYFIILLLICLKNIKWGIFWTIFTLPIYLLRFKVFGLPMTVLEGQILLLFVVFLIKHFKNIKFIKYIKNKNYLFLYFFISLFLIASVISIFIAPNFIPALGIWRAYFLEPILFLIVFVSIIKKDPPANPLEPQGDWRAGDFKIIFKVLSLQVLLLSLFAIIQKFTGIFISNPFWQAEATRRVTSIFPYPNALALYLAPIVILLLGWFVVNIKNREEIGNWKLVIGNYLYLISCIFGIVAIYWTKSKGALIAILCGIIFYAIFYKGFRKIFTGILVLIFISLFLYFSISGVNISQTLKGNSTVEGGDSISTRLEMWSETWQMLKTTPILGAGLAGYQNVVAPFHEKDYIEIYLYPHNIFLNFWTETGLLGLLAFLGIIIWFYRTGFVVETQQCYVSTDTKNLSIILMASMTVLLIHGLVDVPYFKNDLAVLFWLIIGLIIINKNEKYEEQKITL